VPGTSSQPKAEIGFLISRCGRIQPNHLNGDIAADLGVEAVIDDAHGAAP